MRLYNHIANRFLYDPDFIEEMMSTFHPDWKSFLNQDDPEKADKKKFDEIYTTLSIIMSKSNQSYFVTNTVMDKLGMLKVKKRENNHFDWTVFSNCNIGKRTFIFSDNKLLRINNLDNPDVIHLCWTSFKFKDKSTGAGQVHWIMCYVNRKTGYLSSNFDDADVINIEETMYKIMCFIFLSENEEIIVKPGQKHGTQKSGKLINDFSDNIIVVNSKWNVTSIRNEGFDVAGHFAIRHTGHGRGIPKMVLIQPFRKHGYVRRAKNNLEPAKN